MVDKTTEGQPGQSDQQGNPATEGSGTPKGNLEKLLASWEQPSQGTDGANGKPATGGKSPGNGKPPGPPANDDELANLRAELSRQSYETDMKSLVTEVKGELDVDFDDVEGWLNNRANKDPRLAKAWEERHVNKSAFKEVVKALVPEYRQHAESFAKKVVKPAKDEGGKGDESKGLAAAVRNARDASPSSGFEDKNFSTMSDNELAVAKHQIFGLARAGKLK